MEFPFHIIDSIHFNAYYYMLNEQNRNKKKGEPEEVKMYCSHH